jgi:hypothetical protein
MQREKMDLMSKMLAKMAAYQKCRENKCKLETNAQKQATAKYKIQLAALRSDFMAQKLPLDKFKMEVQRISAAMMDLEESKKSNECSLKKCKAELIHVLDLVTNITKEECKRSKLSKTCDASKDFQRFKSLIQKDKMTHEQMKAMALKFMNSSMS